MLIPIGIEITWCPYSIRDRDNAGGPWDLLDSKTLEEGRVSGSHNPERVQEYSQQVSQARGLVGVELGLSTLSKTSYYHSNLCHSLVLSGLRAQRLLFLRLTPDSAPTIERSGSAIVIANTRAHCSSSIAIRSVASLLANASLD